MVADDINECHVEMPLDWKHSIAALFSFSSHELADVRGSLLMQQPISNCVVEYSSSTLHVIIRW